MARRGVELAAPGGGGAKQLQRRGDRARRQAAHLATEGPVTANVNAGPENLFVPQIVIDQGSGAGVSVGDPVIDGPLVGTVTEAAADRRR